MAKYYGGPNSPYYGKVGAVVARKWRTENVVSMYQPKVSNPQTKPQMMNRMKFSALSNMCGIIAKALNIGFKPASMGSKLFPRCFFMKRNFGNVTVTWPDTITIDYSSMLIAEGGLTGVAFGSPQFDEPAQVSVGFSANNDAPDVSFDDEVYVLVYSPEHEQSVLSTPVRRNEDQVVVQVPAYWSGDKVYLWGFVRKAGELDTVDDISMSYYIGTGNIG